MKKVFEIRDIDCANCALKIENEFKKIEGLSQVRLDFARQKVFIDGDTKDIDAAFLEKVAHKVEDGISIFDQDQIIHEKQKFTLNHGFVLIGISILIIFFITDLFIADIPSPIALCIYIIVYLLIGGKVIYKALKNITKGQVFDENFLMMIATIGAFFIQEYIEGIAVMLFYQIGTYFQDVAVHRARHNIKALMDLKPVVAHVLSDQGISDVKPEDLSINDQILVKPGEKFPVDGIILNGQSQVDQSSMTGESEPVYKTTNDRVLSGTINLNGALTILVDKTYLNSSVYKVIEFVEQNMTKKAKTEQFITKFSKYYTPIVVGIALVLAFLVPYLAMIVNQSAYILEFPIYLKRALIFLVVSCPCALVLSIPLSFYAGIGKTSKQGVLVKSGSDLETFSQVDHIVFDKTGTLTKGEFVVTKVYAEDKDLILKLASHAESKSNHPIALSILKTYNQPIVDADIEDFKEIFGHGITIKYQGKLCLVGNDKLLTSHHIVYDSPKINHSLVHVAYDGLYMGYIVLEDELKISAKQTIDTLKKMGKKISLMTGDHEFIAKDIANKLGIDNVYYEKLPYEKKQIIDTLKREEKVAFIGDGMNDAPVLMSADLGVSMGMLGSDLAVEASDAVIMTDEPIHFIDAIKTSILTRKVVLQNMSLAIGTKFIVLILGALGFANMWLAIFADVGISLIAVIHAMHILSAKNEL